MYFTLGGNFNATLRTYRGPDGAIWINLGTPGGTTPTLSMDETEARALIDALTTEIERQQ